MIDEKELTEISAVIELTKWVNEGNVIPYFLWCLRDFMLDSQKYDTADHYLEEIVGTKGIDPHTDKFRIRKNFNDFFKDRGCMFFVRPVNEEAKLRKIEKLNYNEIRPEFLKSVEEFKDCIQHHLKPKRYNNRILNGNTFVKLIEEILFAFNNQKVPEITSTVERVLESERRELVEQLRNSINKYIKENIDESNLHQKGVSMIWDHLTEMALKRQDPELPGQIFGELLKYFYQRLEMEKNGKYQKALKDFENDLDDILTNPDFKFEDLYDQIKTKFTENNLTDRDFPGRYVLDKIINKIWLKVSSILHDLENHYKYELEEKEKDIENEKEKKKYTDSLLKDQKNTLADYQKKMANLEQLVKTKQNEISTLKSVEGSEQALLNQLSIDKERIAKLEKENKELFARLSNGTGMDLKASTMIQNFAMGDNYIPDAEGLKEFLEYLKEELLRENNETKERLDEALNEIQYLKSNHLDSQDKDQIIADLKQRLQQATEKNTYGNQIDPEMAMIIAENKKFKAEKIYYFYVIKEAIKIAKKQKHQMKNAVSFLSDEDANEVLKILKEFKLSY